MPSNELTWALYGMATVAAPIVAVWLWRWLGRKRATRCKCMGWHPDYGSDTSLCPVHGKQAIPYAQSAKAPGSKPDAPWVTREEFEIVQKESIQNHSAIWCVEKRLDALEAKEPEAGRGGDICELCCGRGYEIIDCGNDGFRPLNCPRCKGSGKHRG